MTTLLLQGQGTATSRVEQRTWFGVFRVCPIGVPYTIKLGEVRKMDLYRFRSHLLKEKTREDKDGGRERGWCPTWHTQIVLHPPNPGSRDYVSPC